MNKQTNNIFLIGPLGAGKTSVGKALAKMTRRIFRDSDYEIEKRTGVNIPWIFEVEGEPGFRKREIEIITLLTQEKNIVLSTGGGVVLAPENRKNLAENGIVVYLQVSVERQMDRVMVSKHTRPLLKTYDTPQKLQALNQMREPLYREIANFTYQTDDFKPAELAALIAEDIALHHSKAG